MCLRKGIFGMSEPEDGNIGEQSGHPIHPEPGRRQASVIGLSVVSALNIICLAFVAFHFVGHEDQTGRSELSEPLSPMPRRPLQLPQQEALPAPPAGSVGVLGNIDFAPMTQRVIAIASGFDEDISSTLEPSSPTTLAALPQEPTERIDTMTTDPKSWVQLGALSRETTARSYWSSLAKKHKSLLDGWPPRYFAPDTVGGSLYHLRVGPMAPDQAAKLCNGLKSAGTDCYCIGPQIKKTS
jgi:hypothetical protein